MIVAVTGGTGFIGKKLVARLVAWGHTVRLLTRRGFDSPERNSALDMRHCNLLTADVADLSELLDGAEVLYHCAGQIGDTRTMRELHVEATRKLVRAATGRIRHWVQLSSVGVYGPVSEGVVTEASELDPRGEYEVTKTEAELLVAEATRAGDFDYSVLRPSNVYGAGMPNQSLYSLISMIQRGLFFFVGKPGASANYIHVDNVAEALLLCGTMPRAAGQVYNLSDYRTMEQFIAVIARLMGKETPHVRVPESFIRPLAKLLGNLPGMPLTEARVAALTGRAIYSNKKIERELGYYHRICMEDGLTELVGYWRETAGE